MTRLSPVCVRLIDFIEACEVRSEWVPVSLSGPGGPQHSRAPSSASPSSDWLRLQHWGMTERERERERGRGAFLSNSSGFPEIPHCAFVQSTRTHKDSISLARASLARKPRVHLAEGAVCYLSLSASFSLFAHWCVHTHVCVCARQLCNLFSLEDDQVKDTCCWSNWHSPSCECEREKKKSACKFQMSPRGNSCFPFFYRYFREHVEDVDERYSHCFSFT